METVVGSGGNEGKFEDSGTEGSPSLTSSCKQLADPVVYKLVRVEVDGRLVPATDDEIMEVVDMIKDDNSGMPIITECRQTPGTAVDGSSSGKSLSALSGFSKLEDLDSDAEKLDAPNQENAIQTCSEIEQNKGSAVDGECSKSPEPTSEGQKLCVATNSKPDFTWLQGDIFLHKLSIRELQETFRATFGRETTVKDKTWLKRRIAMGLTNSCDIPTAAFIIRNNKVVKIGKDGISTNSTSISPQDPGMPSIEEKHESVIQTRSQPEEGKVSCRRRPRNYEVDDDCGSGLEISDHDYQMAKRLRKPTRRYIEELSEVDDGTFRKLPISTKGSESASRGLARSTRYDGRTLVMRFNTLVGVQVPCISRPRRSRPRKDVMSLLGTAEMESVEASIDGDSFRCQPLCETTDTGQKSYSTEEMNMPVRPESVEASIDGKSLRCQPPCETADIGQKSYSGDEMNMPKVEETETNHTHSVTEVVGMASKFNSNCIVVNSDFSNVGQDAVTKTKGRIWRKHHKAWTLSEVLKLVEGVSMYGAGRWSEIKRLSFAPHTYRTSVDLKDKWRNLLKASSAPAPADNRMNARKPTSTPIPASILLRVRQLAKMNAPTPPLNMNSRKLMGCDGGRMFHTQSGYL